MTKSIYFDVPYNCKNMTIALGSIALMFAIVIFSNEEINESFYNYASNYTDKLLSNIDHEGYC